MRSTISRWTTNQYSVDIMSDIYSGIIDKFRCDLSNVHYLEDILEANIALALVVESGVFKQFPSYFLEHDLYLFRGILNKLQEQLSRLRTLRTLWFERNIEIRNIKRLIVTVADFIKKTKFRLDVNHRKVAAKLRKTHAKSRKVKKANKANGNLRVRNRKG